MRRHGLFHRGPVLDAAREHARHGTTLAGRRHGLEVEVGQTAQLVDDALAHHGQAVPHRPWVEVTHVGHRLAAERLQLDRRRRADAPHLVERRPREPGAPLPLVRQVADAT